MTTRAIQVSTIPSIEIFVRHSSACPRRDDPEYKKCNCPKHLRYTHNGKQHRQSAKTRAWKPYAQKSGYCISKQWCEQRQHGASVVAF
jgi:hypothetical protein